MKEIRLFKSPGRAIQLIALSSIFVFLGVWGLNNDIGRPLVNWFSILFFGLGYPVAIFYLLDRRPQIIVNQSGIFDRTTHKDFINWEIIENAYIMDIHGQKFICLIVPETFKPSKKRGKIYQSVAKLSEDLGGQELNISLGQIKGINIKKFTEFILAMRTATRKNKELLIEKALIEWS